MLQICANIKQLLTSDRCGCLSLQPPQGLTDGPNPQLLGFIIIHLSNNHSWNDDTPCPCWYAWCSLSSWFQLSHNHSLSSAATRIIHRYRRLATLPGRGRIAGKAGWIQPVRRAPVVGIRGMGMILSVIFWMIILIGKSLIGSSHWNHIDIGFYQCFS